jgi:acetylornithine/N-succinyldiaminopimelate aminotransferase
MTTSQEALVGFGRDFLYPNYRQPPLVLARGQGSSLYDVNGKRYLDLFAGIAVSTLGHAHPRLVRAISEQAERVLHVSNYFFNEPNVRLAERLCRASGMARVFFCSSGAEAIEASLKLARSHFFAQGQPERLRIIAFDNSFHGRTLGALAVTGQPKYRRLRSPARGDPCPVWRPSGRRASNGVRRRGRVGRTHPGRGRRATRAARLPCRAA